MRMKITDLILAAVVMGMLFGAPNLGRAGPITVLPTAVWSGTVRVTSCASSLNICGVGINDVTGPGVTGAFPIDVTGTTMPMPSILAEVTVAPISLPIDSHAASADVQLLYNIEVLCSSGSGCPLMVPVSVTGIDFSTSSAVGGDTASSEVKLIIGGFPTIFDHVSTNGVGGSSEKYSATLGFVPNFIYTVQMEADANASTHDLGTPAASAYIDPFFFIDPSFPNAGQYSILTSPGIGNTPAVPEPSTWMMLLTGMAGLGLLKLIVGRRSVLLPPQPSLNVGLFGAGNRATAARPSPELRLVERIREC